MNEHQPVVRFSSHVPAEVIQVFTASVRDVFEYRSRRGRLTDYAFRGRVVAWLQDDFEQIG